MTQRNLVTLLLSVCGVLLIVGFVVSARIEQGISHAAYVEATQQSKVPTPSALLPARHKAG